MLASFVAVRIAHLVLSLETGGLERVVADLVGRADRSRFEPTVICIEKEGPLGARCRAAGARVHCLGTASRPQALARLVQALRAIDPQVVHAHNPKAHHLAAAARAFHRYPVLLVTRHGRGEHYGSRSAWYSRLANRVTDAVVAVSDDVANQLRLAEGVRPEQLVTILNGVEVPKGLASPGPRAICVARLSILKDIPTLLRAARRIAQHDPRFRLEILGDGPERARVEAMRREWALEGVVEIRGEVGDVTERLVQAGLFVLPSRSEGISIAILEAMAAGLPVVATRVGGNVEIVVEGETGLLVEPGDDAALASAIGVLLDDPLRAQAMGRAGRGRVEERFTLGRVVSRYEELYEQMLLRRSAA